MIANPLTFDSWNTVLFVLQLRGTQAFHPSPVPSPCPWLQTLEAEGQNPETAACRA